MNSEFGIRNSESPPALPVVNLRSGWVLGQSEIGIG
jgi:hypothetical protein